MRAALTMDKKRLDGWIALSNRMKLDQRGSCSRNGCYRETRNAVTGELISHEHICSCHANQAFFFKFSKDRSELIYYGIKSNDDYTVEHFDVFRDTFPMIPLKWKRGGIHLRAMAMEALEYMKSVE